MIAGEPRANLRLSLSLRPRLGLLAMNRRTATCRLAAMLGLARAARASTRRDGIVPLNVLQAGSAKRLTVPVGVARVFGSAIDAVSKLIALLRGALKLDRGIRPQGEAVSRFQIISAEFAQSVRSVQ